MWFVFKGFRNDKRKIYQMSHCLRCKLCNTSTVVKYKTKMKTNQCRGRNKFLNLIKILNVLSLTLRGERRLRVFENSVLWRVFGPKRDEVTREWRKLHNEELNDLYSLPNIVRVSSWWWAVCRPKHVEQLRNTGIIYSTTRLHLVGSFYKIYKDFFTFTFTFTFTIQSLNFVPPKRMKNLLTQFFVILK
jgi:hypothetical protein